MILTGEVVKFEDTFIIVLLIPDSCQKILAISADRRPYTPNCKIVLRMPLKNEDIMQLRGAQCEFHVDVKYRYFNDKDTGYRIKSAYLVLLRFNKVISD